MQNLLNHISQYSMCYTPVFAFGCGYAGSSFEVKTETDSADVMEYLLSMTLNTSHVRTST